MCEQARIVQIRDSQKIMCRWFAHHVGFRLRDPIKNKLDEMERLKLICKVTEPTEWVNPMLAVQKTGGDLRIYLDPLYLNKEIKRQHYPVPTAQELFARIIGKNW